MITYTSGVLMLKGKSEKKIDHNTKLVRLSDSSLAVRLYNTDVVVIHSDDTFQLYTGGFETVTTKDRINKFSPVSVYAKKRVWYVNGNTVHFKFVEGIRVNTSGQVLSEVAQ